MRLIPLLVCLLANLLGQAQSLNIQIDKRGIVHGVAIQSANPYKDPRTGKNSGIKIGLSKNTDKVLEWIEWGAQFFDVRGKMILDTTVTNYLISERPEREWYIISTAQGYDSIPVLPLPGEEDWWEKERENNMHARQLIGGVTYWPKNAVRAKVKLKRAHYEGVTYYAPGE